MDNIDFKSELILLLGEPKNKEDLHQYVEFCRNYVLSESEEYKEKHHILPRSKFPQYGNSQENIVLMLYQDHIKAHVLLAKAYNIKAFTRTLHFMLCDEGKIDVDYSKLLSESNKASWIKFKNSEAYASFVTKRREHMINGHAEFMHQILANKLKTDKAFKENFSKTKSVQFKLAWSDPVRKAKWIENQKASFTPERKKSMAKSLRATLAARTPEEKAKFLDKMDKMNKNPIKRKIAGDKIKDMWKNDKAYIDKMKKRKHSGGNSVSLSAVWADPQRRAKMLALRKATRLKNALLAISVEPDHRNKVQN